MSTLSVRTVALNCLSIAGDFSIKRNLYGYPWGQIDRDLHVRRHLDLIKGPSIDLYIFPVGHEPDLSGWWDGPEMRSIQLAIDVMRELYAKVDLGVRRLHWRHISTEDEFASWSVTRDQAIALTQQFSGPDDGIDVFFVKDVSDAGGWSNSDGPCDKSEEGDLTGAVLQLLRDDCASRGRACTGILLAHEVGHYLTLPHFGSITNVMGEAGRIGRINNTSVDLTESQGEQMKMSCFIRPEC